MGRIEENLRRAIEARPDEVVHAIIRTEGAAAPHVQTLESRGLTVHRVFKLVPGMAVSGEGAALLDLTGATWVKFIEADRPVEALD